MLTPSKGTSPDLEAQEIGFLRSGNDLKDARIEVTVEDFSEKSTPALTRDGAIRLSQESSRAAFLSWTIINTLATIGIVNGPLLWFLD